ncbi:MAG: malate synthase A [Rickettsiales bacterium]|nr:malate synthase A [Rickettsiales bacterium]
MTAQPNLSESPLSIQNPVNAAGQEILTDDALAFVAALAEKFQARRDALLVDRVAYQKKLDEGFMPDFLEETKAIREGDWKVAPIPEDLQNRRVEITGPAEPKMIINALNSGAKVFMADIEDSLSPTWEKVVEAQVALRDAVRRELTFTSPEGKKYELKSADELAVMIVRPRGWHLDEKHVLFNGKPLAGALLDFGLFFYHNAKEQLARGTGPYFYIPKLENHKEAQLWADIFAFGEEYIGLEKGSIKATILIEVITAVFEMDEILHALKDYIVGLNCGRWDYIFSFIKKFAKRGDFVLPDRAQVTMRVPFLQAYSDLLIHTCHKRGAFAMGGMAPQIPIKGDDAANEKALGLVKADKEREAGWGHDGTWVAHPGLIPIAMEVFDRMMPAANQVDNLRPEVSVDAADLLAIPEGTITEAGIRNNINVSIQYMAAWLDGNGCVPINNLMEDAATAEISRTQLWQWAHHDDVKRDDGAEVSMDMIRGMFPEEMDAIKAQVGEAAFSAGKYKAAADLLLELIEKDEFIEFLTLPAYEQLA